MVDTILLAIIALLLAALLIQARRQGAELIEWLDALGDMIGDAIASWERKGK